MIRPIHQQLMEKIGETAYTPLEIRDILTELKVYPVPSADTLREYVKNNSMFVDFEKEGIETSPQVSSIKYVVPKSKVSDLIQIMKLPYIVRKEDIEEAAIRLGYRI